MEAITWKRLELINIPIFIVNLDGFYDPLLALFENMFKERFIDRSLEKNWIVVKSVDEVIEKLKSLI
jgi:predicted Rossmann-fold nucleotide-binding protein